MPARVGTSVREDNQSQVQLEVATGHHLAMLCPNKRGNGGGERRFLRPATDGFGAGAMGDMNAKVGMDNTGREEVMGMHGAGAEMNGNCERWVDFCQANELVIGGTLFPYKECHKRTWRSPDGVTTNQIDHLAFSKRRRSSLQDVRVLREADAGSNHHLLMAKLRLKIAEVRKAKCAQVCFEVSKLKDLEVRSVFKLALHNRFEGLQQLMEEEELSVDDEWRLIEQGYVETCGQVLGRAKANRKEQISRETWEVIEQRKVAKKTP